MYTAHTYICIQRTHEHLHSTHIHMYTAPTYTCTQHPHTHAYSTHIHMYTAHTYTHANLLGVGALIWPAHSHHLSHTTHKSI